MQFSRNSGSEEGKAYKNDSLYDSYQQRLLVWSSWGSNNVRAVDFLNKQEHTVFEGIHLKIQNDLNTSWTHVKEIPGTNLLVSLHHAYNKSANMGIFDLSPRRKIRQVYSFEEVLGVTGNGDVTYNSRRGILGAICVEGKIANHLFHINGNPSKIDHAVAKLCRKSSWDPHYSTLKGNFISSLDIDPSGETMATIDRYGVCLISDLNTNSYLSVLNLITPDMWKRCRWSSEIGQPFLYIKYNARFLNILDVEKKTLTLKLPIQLDKDINTPWIDVCPTEGNLVASAGSDIDIKIYDRRESRIIKIFSGVHSDWINCVRWNSDGSLLATASNDKKAGVVDFRTEKTIYTGSTPDYNDAMSVCFI